MTTLRLLSFSGEIPRLIPRLLNDANAQAAYNTRLDDGGLTPIRRSKLIEYLSTDDYPDEPKTIYLHNDKWLIWADHVNVIPGPVAQDRLYVFGEGKPQIIVDNDTYDLAIIAPDDALEVEVSGDGDADLLSSRMYAYTLVSNLGEESEPSPLTKSIDWKPGQTVTLSGFKTSSPNRTITHQRIYRSQTGTSGGTDLFLIAERPVSADPFVDEVPSDEFMERLPTRNWNPPPEGLKGAITLPNGMIAAFKGKDLYFCEPWIPHAWPESYVLTCDYEIVGLGAYSNTIVVATKGNPYMVTGNMPETMVMEKLELNLPCVNPLGIQDLGYAVVYPSNEGLVTVSNGSAAVTTTSLMSRDGWQSMKPSEMYSGQFNSRYFSSYDYIDLSGQQNYGTLIFDFTGEQPFLVRAQFSANAYFFDKINGKLYYLENRGIYEYDSTYSINETQYWKSKEFVLPRPVNFGAILVEVDSGLSDTEQRILEQEYDEAIERNEVLMDSPLGGELNGSTYNSFAVNGDNLEIVPDINRNVSVHIYADGHLVAAVSRYNQMARLPSGFLARRWEVSVTGDMPVTQITLATTGAELMEV